MTFHDFWHLMTFDILWHFTFHDILHCITFYISWHLTINRINIQHACTAYHRYGQHTNGMVDIKYIQCTIQHTISMDNKPQIRSINKSFLQRGRIEMMRWIKIGTCYVQTLGTITVVTMQCLIINRGPIAPSLCQINSSHIRCFSELSLSHSSTNEMEN